MKIIKIIKEDWARGIDRTRAAYHLFGPVKATGTGKTRHVFRPLEKDQYPDMDHTDSVLSPKSLVFPQTQTLLTSSLDDAQEGHHRFEAPAFDDTPRAVIGIRPSDAKAMDLVKQNFDTQGIQDPYWCQAHGATTFVGLGINTPSPFDFSTTAGSGPFDETGLDLLLADCQGHYLAKVLTPKGEAFLIRAGFTREEDPKKGNETIQEMRQMAEQAMGPGIETDRLMEKTVLDLHEASFWDDLAFSCINCGTCTYVCPTCWCFDIQDEIHGKTAHRIRNWDTCMSPLFTRHGSGHNPRGEKVQRVRQRFMHKLKYFLEKYDRGIMCVGCGRCVEKCPVNIDIRNVTSLMNSHEPSNQAAV